MVCTACHCDKPATDFYASNRSRCKACVKAGVKAHRAANQQHYREYERERVHLPHRVAARAAYAQTDAYAESHAAAARRWAARNPLQRAAQIAVNNAVRDRRLVPWPVCAVPTCGSKPEAHHPDYSRPLDVVWLCPPHHDDAHELAANEADGRAEAAA